MFCKLDLHAPTIFCKEVKLYICTLATLFTNELSILKPSYRNAIQAAASVIILAMVNSRGITKAKILLDIFSEVGHEDKFILLAVAFALRKTLNRNIRRNRICQI